MTCVILDSCGFLELPVDWMTFLIVFCGMFSEWKLLVPRSTQEQQAAGVLNFLGLGGGYESRLLTLQLHGKIGKSNRLSRCFSFIAKSIKIVVFNIIYIHV